MCRQLYELFIIGPPDGDLIERYFEQPIFFSEQGKKFKNLIINLTDRNPSKRISLSEAQKELVQLGPFYNIIKNLRACSVGDNDQGIEEYINKKINAYCSDISSQARKNIIDEMETCITDLNRGANKEVMEMIEQYKKSGKALASVGNLRKAERITQALQAIPVEQRQRLSESKDNKITVLKESIASHRHFWRSSPKANKNGVIDNKKAANAFKNMKNKFKEVNPTVNAHEDNKESKPNPSHKP